MWPEKSSLKFNTNRLRPLEHLEELRKRLLVFLAALGIFSVAAYFFSKPLLEFLTLPLAELDEGELYFHAPYDAFLVHLKVALVAGALLASPVFFTELWLFVAPGLYRAERRIFLPLVVGSTLLFLAGAAFAFWGIVPLGLRFLLSYGTESLKPLLSAGPYFSFLTGMMLACGLLFDLPLVILGLVAGKILSVDALRRARKGVVISAFVLAAILTPSPDPVGQILLALPLLLLYEACIWLAKLVERKG